ncbi:hypothetical protein [Allomuricauda sp. d1]|uniref:hypothetical protein n=1 Tax=Allomuricauda sp. d1 TaxID=3136725 RepID=UPI0031E100FF
MKTKIDCHIFFFKVHLRVSLFVEVNYLIFSLKKLNITVFRVFISTENRAACRSISQQLCTNNNLKNYIMIYGISLVLLSIIAVPSLILSKKPNAKELLEKIEPYQGWIGLIFCFWGAWGIISSILNLGLLTTAPIWWITLAAGSVVEVTLGFMLGSGLFNKLFLGKSPEAQQKAAELRAKIAPKQGKLGVLGIIVGVWMIVASFLFTIS